MAHVYWIEDEISLLQRTLSKLEGHGYDVHKMFTVAQVLKQLKTMKSRPGLVILDLYLPRGVSDELPDGLEELELGMWLLSKLHRGLGPEQPIVILSGNISLDITDRLVAEVNIPKERIFSKPLAQEGDNFIALVDRLVGSLAKSTVGE